MLYSYILYTCILNNACVRLGYPSVFVETRCRMAINRWVTCETDLLTRTHTHTQASSACDAVCGLQWEGHRHKVYVPSDFFCALCAFSHEHILLTTCECVYILPATSVLTLVDIQYNAAGQAGSIGHWETFWCLLQYICLKTWIFMRIYYQTEVTNNNNILCRLSKLGLHSHLPSWS